MRYCNSGIRSRIVKGEQEEINTQLYLDVPVETEVGIKRECVGTNRVTSTESSTILRLRGE